MGVEPAAPALKWVGGEGDPAPGRGVERRPVEVRAAHVQRGHAPEQRPAGIALRIERGQPGAAGLEPRRHRDGRRRTDLEPQIDRVSRRRGRLRSQRSNPVAGAGSLPRRKRASIEARAFSSMASSPALLPPDTSTRVRLAERTTASMASCEVKFRSYSVRTPSRLSGFGKLTLTMSAPSSLAVRAA